jgi:hypothetical protein
MAFGETALDLQKEMKFEAKNLGSEYFSCPEVGGVVKSKTGSGAWRSGKASEASAVYLK